MTRTYTVDTPITACGLAADRSINVRAASTTRSQHHSIVRHQPNGDAAVVTNTSDVQASGPARRDAADSRQRGQRLRALACGIVGRRHARSVEEG